MQVVKKEVKETNSNNSINLIKFIINVNVFFVILSSNNILQWKVILLNFVIISLEIISRMISIGLKAEKSYNVSKLIYSSIMPAMNFMFLSHLKHHEFGS